MSAKDFGLADAIKVYMDLEMKAAGLTDDSDPIALQAVADQVASRVNQYMQDTKLPRITLTVVGHELVIDMPDWRKNEEST